MPVKKSSEFALTSFLLSLFCFVFFYSSHFPLYSSHSSKSPHFQLFCLFSVPTDIFTSFTEYVFHKNFHLESVEIPNAFYISVLSLNSVFLPITQPTLFNLVWPELKCLDVSFHIIHLEQVQYCQSGCMFAEDIYATEIIGTWFQVSGT